MAQQLKIVSQLIAGGLKSKIFVVRLGGFDTHDNQVDSGSTETGRHAGLMQELSESVFAFQKDIIDRGLEERILTMTYSEFGRRVFQNKSYGTDHGEAAPMFFMSPFVNPNPIGSLPSLEYIDNIEYELNFRLHELLEETSYLETAYKQLQDTASKMDDGKKFLSYPIPKAIVEAWEKVK